MHADRIKALADDLYSHLFSVLDQEPDLTGLEAGQIATTVQKAFESAAETGTAADFARQSISEVIRKLQKREGVALLSLANLRQIAETPKNDASWTVPEYWAAFDSVAMNEFSAHIL